LSFRAGLSPEESALLPYRYIGLSKGGRCQRQTPALDPQATPEPSARLKIPVPEPQAKCASVL